MADEQISVDEFLHARKDHSKGDTVLKAARGRASTWDEKARTCRFVMSAEVEDRDRDIVIQEGLDLTEFLKNPVVPFSHASTTFPVGTWDEVEKVLNGRPKRTEGTATLVPDGKDGVADRLAFHMGAGSIRAASIGFIPKKIRRREESEDGQGSYRYPGYIIEEAELIECSIVVIPSNPAALAKSAKDGELFARETIEMVLDTWAKTEAGLLVRREDFEAAHREASGEKTSVVVQAPAADEAERGLFSKFLSWLGQDGKPAEPDPIPAQADETHAHDAELQKAVEEAEARLLLAETESLERRLAQRGITASAA